MGHVKRVPCLHGMARPQVADGRDSLQIWRVAANILNKQLLTADKGLSSSWGVEHEADNSSPHKNKLFTKCHKAPRTWTESFDKRFGHSKVEMEDTQTHKEHGHRISLLVFF
jgi:hypothetical protein